MIGERRGAGGLPARGARRRGHLPRRRPGMRRAGRVSHGGRGTRQHVRGLRGPARPVPARFLDCPRARSRRHRSRRARELGVTCRLAVHRGPPAAQPARRRARASFRPVRRSRPSRCSRSTRTGRVEEDARRRRRAAETRSAATGWCWPVPRVHPTRRRCAVVRVISDAARAADQPEHIEVINRSSSRTSRARRVLCFWASAVELTPNQRIDRHERSPLVVPRRPRHRHQERRTRPQARAVLGLPVGGGRGSRATITGTSAFPPSTPPRTEGLTSCRRPETPSDPGPGVFVF